MPTRQPLPQALAHLRTTLDGLSFVVPTVSAREVNAKCLTVCRQLDDYILPRFANLDAPLLAVIGGSTGAGKSTLVNSLLRRKIARSSAIRPTTRRPMLIHHPDDAHWFSDARVLPGLARVHGSTDTTNSYSELELVAAEEIPQGLALLDSPDIDSVVEENRRLANQLLSAADLWLFTTTAARYADALAWNVLDEAAQRDIVIAVVLDRVPVGDAAEVRADLSKRLAQRGLQDAPLFVISEGLDDDGFVPQERVASIREWLEGIAHDASARASVARQSLVGAVDNIVAVGDSLNSVHAEYVDIARDLSSELDTAFNRASQQILDGVAEGNLLRGEVLERWQNVVGTGEWMKRLESGISSLRDRLTTVLRGKNQQRDFEEVEVAIEDTLVQLLVAKSEQAIFDVDTAWSGRAGVQPLLDAALTVRREHDERYKKATELVHAWQRDVVEMISQQGHSKVMTAKVLSWSVNALGAALMIVIFASTSGLTGSEVAVAGGTAVVAERVLEAVFGDDAVRRMAKKARDNFTEQADAFLNVDRAPFADVVKVVDSSAQELERACAGIENVRKARREV